MRTLTVQSETFPIAGTFTISRGSKTEAQVITCTIGEGAHIGRGECVPYARYGETLDSVRAEIEAARGEIQSGADRTKLPGVMRQGAARNAVDCALWDLEAKISARSVAEAMGLTNPLPLTTAFTLSLAEPDAMYAQAEANAWRPLLKMKAGTDRDQERMRAVFAGAPNSRIIVDANEGWSQETLSPYLALAADLGIALIEQPLKAGEDTMLRHVEHLVPICADESVHGADDLDQLSGFYDAINIKLDKTGGLTAAIALRKRAEQLGFSIMVGCMVGSSLAMAPAVLLAQGADFVDLDGPLLLARDREPHLVYTGSSILPPEPSLWG